MSWEETYSSLLGIAPVGPIPTTNNRYTRIISPSVVFDTFGALEWPYVNVVPRGGGEGYAPAIASQVLPAYPNRAGAPYYVDNDFSRWY